MYCNSEIIHITLDSGAEAPCIIPEECKRLGLKIYPPNQIANSIDKRNLEVIGEVKTVFERGPLKLTFEALVIPKIDGAKILAGSPFFDQHQIDICYSTRTVKIGRKYSIPWSPSEFLLTPDKPAAVVKIARTTVLLHDDTLEMDVPCNFPSNSTLLVYPHSDKITDFFAPQQVEAVGRTVKIKNYSSEPLVLEKNMHAFGIRAMKSLQTVERHEPFEKLTKYSPPKVNPEEYLSKLNVDLDKVVRKEEDGAKVLEKLDKINRKYHAVFNGDLSEGYNGASGPCTADWDFIQEPPVSHSKVPIYAKDEQLYKLQLKIDHLHHQGIVRKPQELGINIKLVNPIMMVKKGSAKEKPWDQINPLTDTRAVLAANILNEWSEDVPGNIVTPDQHLAKVTKFKYHITTDMADSFDQIHVNNKKLPYMGFNSPFKGQYIFTRSGQGRKGSSEKLNELTSMCFGHLLAEGWLAIIHDDIHIGGQTPSETVENWEKFLQAADKNNIKINPRKTYFFPKKFDCVGFIIDGQKAIPSAHRTHALKNYDLPITVGQLRSYLGLYKTFLRNQKDQAKILDKLHQLTGNNHNTKDRISWTEELKLVFYDSQAKVDTIIPLYNPKPDDQLIVTWDWCETKRAIGATLWAVSEGKKHVCSYYSLMLDKSVKKKLLACEGEALAAKFAIFAFRMQLIRSKNVNLGLTDNEIFYQAYRLLARGSLSTSQKLNALAVAAESANVQIQHLSGKMGFNIVSDQFSRFPTKCEEPGRCEICRFVNEAAETSDAVVISKCTVDYSDEKEYANDDVTKEENTASIFALKATEHPSYPQNITLTDDFILAEQKQDSDIQQTIWFLENRRRPSDRDTSVGTVKHYLRYTKDKASKEGYLVVNKKGMLMMNQSAPGTVFKTERPIIPEHLAPALIATIHLKRNHPKLSQIQGILKNSFFILKAQAKIDQVLNNCLLCNADEFLKKEMDVYSTSEPPEYPYQKLAADVMKRACTNILVVTDSLTSHTSTSIIKSEKAEDLELALIKTILPFRPGNSVSKVRVDTAPGLKKLIRNPANLSKYDIILDPGRQKNKNSLAIVDKRIRELEDELRKLKPEGDAIDENTLVLATKFLNEKVRQHGYSAKELLFRRNQETLVEIDIKDSELKEKVNKTRKESHLPNSKSKAKGKSPPKTPNISVGQIGFIKHEHSKHSVRPAYYVTKVDEENKIVTAKKMLHVHSKKPTKFQNINYEIKLSDFIPAKCFTIPNSDFNQYPDSEADDVFDGRKFKKNLDLDPSTHSDESDSSDNEDSGHDHSDDNQDNNEQEVTAPHVDHSFELEDSSDEESLENDENDDTEEDLGNVHQENNVHEDQHVAAPDLRPPAPRPQREAKVAAYRDKIWLRDEEDADDDDVIQQMDGNLITPESLTPNTTPEKENDELEETKSNSTTSSKNFHWDNYCSSPELTGYPWEVEESFIESPINTRVYFNRNIIPIKPRLRFKSLSESDIHHVPVEVEDEDQSQNPLQVPDSPTTPCFPTRIFLNTVRKSFRFRSKSNNELSTTLQNTTVGTSKAEVLEDKEH